MSCPLCATTRAERDEALEQVRQLRALAFGGDMIERLSVSLGLSKSRAVVFAVLMQRPLATKETLLDALYFDDHDGVAEPKTLDVMICHIRKKLRPLGIEITTVWGQGWRLSADMKARVRELIVVAE